MYYQPQRHLLAVAESQPVKGRDTLSHSLLNSLLHEDKSRIQCYKCHAWGHTVRECPLKKSATEASGPASSGSSSTVTVDEAEEHSGQLSEATASLGGCRVSASE